MGIRLARYADAVSVAEVHVFTWQVAYKDLLPRDFLEKLSVEAHAERWRKTIRKGAPELLVYEDGAEIQGWVALGPSRDTDASSDIGEIEAIYVQQRAWGTGVGKNLFDAAKMRLKERGFSNFTLWVLSENERAIAFYERAGMKVNRDQRKLVEIGQDRLYEIRYEYRIDKL